ncbi:TELO2-interacting protein 2-like [Athalia rosae]|uniref:TELO2-interacting protein 2-like n=1 Tax=Athalia rosae TaxID=37344 RepID=UPI002033682D|nr:TELO2-interacting protein 2-like [Athalia rosae]
MKMDNLLKELEAMKITGNLSSDNLWKTCIELLENTFVPEKQIGKERPCEEKDYREYRQIVDRNLRNIESTLHHVIITFNDDQNKEETTTIIQNQYVRTFLTYLIIIIGEQSEKSVWNTAESVSIANSMKYKICNFYKCDSISKLLVGEGMYKDSSSNDTYSILNMVLLAVRPKLRKETWKAHPATVNLYKWILEQIEEPNLVNHMSNVIPTALIILDDYVVENRLLGIKCLERISKHAYMRKELVDTGYSEMIYYELTRLLGMREVAYVKPLYSCMTKVLSTNEYYNNTNCLEWTRRDDVLSSLLGNMEYEQNSDLRHAYMCSLPEMLTNIGCSKWCERLARILSEYCENHTDLKTLKVTLQTAKVFLVTLQPRVPSHCVSLYATFLKLHTDLMETPVFDKEIVENLEDCICMLYKLVPSIGRKIVTDDRMKSIINEHLQFKILNDTTYFE